MAFRKISQMTADTAVDDGDLFEKSRLSPTVTITATTISSLASDNSFNDTGAGFIAAGFAVGDQVKATGFAFGVSNIFSGTITALTTTKMTIGGTDGDPIVDNVAGPSITITKWETRRITASILDQFIALSEEFWEASEPQTKTAAIRELVQRVHDLEQGEAGNLLPIVNDSSASRTLSLADVGKYLRMSNAAAVVTVPAFGAVEFSPGEQVHIRNSGSGTVTIDESSTVTINLPNSGSLEIPAGGTVTLLNVDEDEWDLFGQVNAP